MAIVQSAGHHDQSSLQSQPGREGDETPNALGVIVRSLSLFGSLSLTSLGTYNEFLQIQVTKKHDPDVVRRVNQPFVTLFNHYVTAPAAEVVRTIGAEVHRGSSLNIGRWLQDPVVSKAIASVALSLIGLSVAYFSLLGLFRLYGRDWSYKQLRRFAFVAMSIMLLPLAMLSAVHVLQRTFGFDLLPTANDILSDYVIITHAAAANVYGRWFHWTPPVWLDDAAAISLISVGINRKAWLPNETGTYALDWDDFVSWMSEVLHVRNFFQVLGVIPHIVAMLVGFAVGKIFEVIRLRWLSERMAALTFVLVRGVTLVGLIYPFEHAYELLRWRRGESEDDDAEPGASLWYMTYMGLTLAFVTWFIAALRYIPPSHPHGL